MAHPTADWVGLTLNRMYNPATGWVLDDATKPSWAFAINVTGDVVGLERIPAGSTTTSTLLTLDNVGHLTFKAMAASIFNNTPVAGSTSGFALVTMPNVGSDSSGGVMVNAPASNLRSPTTGGWVIVQGYIVLSASVSWQLSIDYYTTAWYPLVQAMGTGTVCSLTGINYAGSSQVSYRLQLALGTAANINSATLTAATVGGP
jgi:hypothetical protein